MADRDYAQVKELLEQRRTVFGSLHREMRIDEEYVEATDQWAHDLMSPYMRAFPVDFKPKPLALARLAMLAMALNLMNGETPKVICSIDGNSGITDYDQTIDDIQAWCRAFLHSIRDQLWTAAKHIGALGCAWPYYGIDKTRYPKEPETADAEALDAYEAERRQAKLVDFRIVHPRRVYWDRDHENPQDCIIEELITPAAANETYPDRGPWTATGQEPHLTRVIYCSATQYGIWVDGVPVLSGVGVAEDGMAKNPYGVLWVSWAFSGIGTQAFDDNPVHEVQGNVRQGRGVIASALVAFNRLELLGATGAMPGRDFSGGTPTDRETVMGNYHVGPLAMNDMGGEGLSEAVMVAVQPVADMPQFTRDQSALIEQYLNLTYGQNFLRGLPTVDNATVNAQNIDLSERLYGAGKASFDGMCADILTTVLSMIRDSLESGQEVFLPDEKADGGYVKLKPSQIPKRGLRLVVDMTPTSMTERQANLQNDKDMMLTLGFDGSWLAARQGIDNYDDERKKGVKNKLFEATADVAAEIMGQTLREMIPERLDITREADVAKGVVERPPAPPTNGRLPLPAGVGY